ASNRRPRHDLLERDYPVDRQQIFGQAAAAAVGFDFDAGRLDVTTHPFCSGLGPGDCRITTRYNPRHFNEAFFRILHEPGLAINDVRPYAIRVEADEATHSVRLSPRF